MLCSLSHIENGRSLTNRDFSYLHYIYLCSKKVGGGGDDALARHRNFYSIVLPRLIHKNKAK